MNKTYLDTVGIYSAQRDLIVYRLFVSKILVLVSEMEFGFGPRSMTTQLLYCTLRGPNPNSISDTRTTILLTNNL
jgi:hypothetical protein